MRLTARGGKALKTTADKMSIIVNFIEPRKEFMNYRYVRPVKPRTTVQLYRTHAFSIMKDGTMTALIPPKGEQLQNTNYNQEQDSYDEDCYNDTANDPWSLYNSSSNVSLLK